MNTQSVRLFVPLSLLRPHVGPDKVAAERARIGGRYRSVRQRVEEAVFLARAGQELLRPDIAKKKTHRLIGVSNGVQKGPPIGVCP